MIGVYFHPESLTASLYDDITRRLEAAGAGSPKGRLYHACFGAPDHLMVFDVFASQADYDAFGAQLMPVLNEIGFDPGTPDVMPIHNVIIGS
ncbi:MAG: hypothetical protein WD904_06440 [Dehalococcoidia bacterium]